jgi:hypothetical protein
MITAEKTPIVIIHERSWRTPKLPAKYRYDYRTEVNVAECTTTLTVTVMKSNLFAKFFLGRDEIVKSLSRDITENGEITASIACTDMEIQLANELFPSL